MKFFPIQRSGKLMTSTGLTSYCEEDLLRLSLASKAECQVGLVQVVCLLVLAAECQVADAPFTSRQVVARVASPLATPAISSQVSSGVAVRAWGMMTMSLQT